MMHFRTLVDVYSLCNYCVLANVLDYKTYQFPMSQGSKPTPRQLRLRAQYDYNALTPVQREYYTYICGLALHFMKWVHSRFSIISTVENRPEETTVSVGTLMLRHLYAQAYAILYYKRKAEAQKVRGIDNCKAADVRRQLGYLFDDNPKIPCELDFDAEDLSAYDCFSVRDYAWRVVRRTPLGLFEGKL